MSFASNRDSGDFSGKYKKTGFFQAEYNEIFIDTIIECIQANFPALQDNSPNNPLRILDIGTGSGRSAKYLLDKLKEKGIYARITASDISVDQIATAKEFECKELEFKVESAESLNAKNQYHLVLCLFSYHWFQDKVKVAKKIKDALREDGIFFSLTPLEKPRLFELREANIRFWQSYLDQVKINPLVDDPQFYQRIFENQFPYIQAQYRRNHHKFSEAKFSEWLSSWTAESRPTTTKTRSKRKFAAMSQQQINELFDSLTASIPEDKHDDVSAEITDEGRVIDLGERVLAVACSKRPLNFTLQAPSVDEDNEKSKKIKLFR